MQKPTQNKEHETKILTLDELHASCGYKTPNGSKRNMYSYSCGHPENPDYCEKHDGNCIASYCPIAYCMDDEEDEDCPELDGEKRMMIAP